MDMYREQSPGSEQSRLASGLSGRESADPQWQAWFDAELKTSRLQLVMRQTPRAVLMSFLGLLVLWIAVWQINPMLTRAEVVWGITFALTLCLRSAGYVWFRGALPEFAVDRWRLLIGLSAFSMGLLWGTTYWVFDFHASGYGVDVMRFGLVLLVAGQTVAALPTYATGFPVYCMYVLLGMLPGVLALWSRGVFLEYWFGALDATLIVLLLSSAEKINTSYRKSMAAQAHNRWLLEKIDQSHTQIVDVNQKLALEVYERTQAEQQLKEINDHLEHLVNERTEELSLLNQDLSNNRERLALAIDAADVGFWDWNIPLDELHHSNFEKLLGYSASELKRLGPNLRSLIHPADYFRVRRALVRHLVGKTPHYRAVYRVAHKEGRWVWVEDRGRVISRDAKGKAIRMLGIRRDISYERLSLERDRLSASVFRFASEGIFILDAEFRFLAVNPYYTQLYGVREENILHRRIDDCQTMPGMKRFYQQITRFLEKDGRWESEFNDYHSDGRAFHQWLRTTAVVDEGGKTTHYVGLITDLTARREAEEKIMFLNNYDNLTGFANRHLFRTRLESLLLAAEEGHRRLAVLFMDLDRFKQINNTLGHEVGDTLLKESSLRLMRVINRVDSVARFGGDEFTLILEGYQSRREVEDFCGRIIGEMRRPFRLGEHEILLGCSLGISLYPEHGLDVQSLLNHADIALHQAKRVGGNTWRFYCEDLRSSSIEQVNLESQLRKAIFRDEFVVYYQPKFSLHNDQMIGVEALVRWNHPQLGLMTPGEFLPIAEESGLISAISELVLDKACRQVQFWIESGVGRIKTSVNISAHQLRKGNLLQIVERVIDSTGVDPHLLEFELTESSLMEDSVGTMEILHQLRAMGVELSLDDFGTGYSSLSYLKKFPIDTLKIDQAFIRDLSSSPDDEAITKAIIAMAHGLKLRVVAEGVETVEIREFLRAEHCDAIQGYLISRPVPESEIGAFLRLP